MTVFKRDVLKLFFSYFLCVAALQADSAPMSNPNSGVVQRSSRIEGPPSLDKSKSKIQPSNAPSSPLNRPNIPIPIPQQASYFHPGILVFRNGTWVGSDHLLNVSTNIGVYVSVVKPEGDKLALSEEQLQKQIEAIFNVARINSRIMVSEGQPPLPFFQIQILAYPIDKGYVIFCEGRLFEAVTLQRFNFDLGMAFQAITWEKKTLQVGPTSKIVEQVQQSVEEIAKAFTERFEAYERIKREGIH